MKTYLITGGAGYLGKNIIKVLCENNTDEVERIIIFDLKVPANTKQKLTALCQSKFIFLYKFVKHYKIGLKA